MLTTTHVHHFRWELRILGPAAIDVWRFCTGPAPPHILVHPLPLSRGSVWLSGCESCVVVLQLIVSAQQFATLYPC